jgi:hypothetical protein
MHLSSVMFAKEAVADLMKRLDEHDRHPDQCQVLQVEKPSDLMEKFF